MNEQKTSKSKIIWDDLSTLEQRVVHRVVQGEHISRDISQEIEAQQSLGDRLADKVASFGGSWPFVILFSMSLLFWIVLNSAILTRIGTPFDPYPYILLNLFLSTLAAIQAPIILMSQNRQAEKDRIQSNHDYEVNLKAEIEIMALHEKIDQIRVEQWEQLVELQTQQIQLLKEISDTLPSNNPSSNVK